MKTSVRTLEERFLGGAIGLLPIGYQVIMAKRIKQCNGASEGCRTL
jgi:hypothetical protein